MSNNGDRPPGRESTITVSFDSVIGQLTYRYTNCGFMEAIALLELAKLHVFNDRLVAQWRQARQKGEGDGAN